MPISYTTFERLKDRGLAAFEAGDYKAAKPYLMQAADAIMSIVDAIGVAFDKFIQYLRFLFDWKDIIKTKKMFQASINKMLYDARDNAYDMKKKRKYYKNCLWNNWILMKRWL